MRSALISLLFVLSLCGAADGQDTIHESVLGQIQMDNDGIWSCQITGSQLCSSCVEDADTPASTPPLVIAFGTTGLQGWSFGTLTGTIQLAIEVDGLTIPPAQLPNTGLTLRVSTRYHQNDFSDNREWIAPHLPAPITMSDYVDGKDPAVRVVRRRRFNG